jgi:hypothetical protein
LPLTTFRRVRGLVHQDTDAVHPPRLLRIGHERRGEDASSQRADERPSIQYPPLAGRFILPEWSWEASGSTLHQGGERVDLDSFAESVG